MLEACGQHVNCIVELLIGGYAGRRRKVVETMREIITEVLPDYFAEVEATFERYAW